jgi:hypothetical protein
MSQHEKHANKIRRPCPACGQQKWLCANTALSRGKDQKPIPRFTIIIEDKDRYRLYKLYAALTRRDSGNPENAARKYITLMLTPRASSTEDVVVKVPVTFKSQDREPYVYICNQKMIEIAKGFKEEVKQVGRGRHPGAYLEDEAGGFICSCFFVSTKTVGTRNV